MPLPPNTRIIFEPKIGHRVCFASDRQFEKGPFDGAVLRVNNGVCEIGHADGKDSGFFIISELKVKSRACSIHFEKGERTVWTLF